MGFRVWVCVKCKRYMGDQLTTQGLHLGGTLVRRHYLVCNSISVKDRYVDKFDADITL